MAKLTIAPDKQGYTLSDNTETLSVKLDGGASRYRKDISNASANITVSWTVNQISYEYLRTFYKGITDSGSLPFTIDLFVNNGCYLLEHEAYFIPGSFKLVSHRGDSFVVSCSMEVTPLPISTLDLDKVFLFNEYSYLYPSKFPADEDILNTIVNVNLPEYM